MNRVHWWSPSPNKEQQPNFLSMCAMGRLSWPSPILHPTLPWKVLSSSQAHFSGRWGCCRREVTKIAPYMLPLTQGEVKMPSCELPSDDGEKDRWGKCCCVTSPAKQITFKSHFFHHLRIHLKNGRERCLTGKQKVMENFYPNESTDFTAICRLYSSVAALY